MPEVEIQGAEQLSVLAKRLKQLGEKDLQRELYAAINRATKPLKEALPRSARETLPKRGGLAERVAKSKYKTTRRTSARAAGIRVTATSKMDIQRMDRGQVRHPVFGRWLPNQKPQEITPGWFTHPAEAAAPLAREELTRAMDQIAAKI